jgi:hypothetical protein
VLGGGSSGGTRRYLGVSIVMLIGFLTLFCMYLIEEKNMYEVLDFKLSPCSECRV